MRIDAPNTQPPWQWNTTSAVQPQNEVAGEREQDGDADDMVQKTAAAPAAQQINPQGVGTKIDVFA